MFYILNREFAHLSETHEKAADPLAGGIAQQGYQCGFVWGAAMAVGAESYRQNEDRDKAFAITIATTQQLMESFKTRTESIDCIDIAEIDWTKRFGVLKSFVTGKFFSCLKLAENWAPDAIKTAKEGLSGEVEESLTHTMNCASEVAKKMGATEEEMHIVAGFAGGMDLSGNGCGALSAAIWMRSLAWGSENPSKKGSYPNPYVTKTLEAFQAETEYEMLCSEISGQSFKTFADHSEFIKNGLFNANGRKYL